MSSVKRDDKNFEVLFYEGYKGRETPRAVVIGEKEFIIEKILTRRRSRDQKTGRTFEIFKCQMEGEIVKITCHESGEWSISFPDES